MFTIVLSLNASYETYQFRQVGGYAHGTFKDVSPEQAERIAAHPKVKAAGARKVIGITVDGVFSKTPAEISYMDANCTKWSYATPTTGRMPESGKEVAMDTAALQLLGVTPELGAEVTVSYSITDKDQTAFTVTDTFTLVGYWDYDELMPVHYINISRDYADDIEAQAVKTGLQPFRHRFECHAGIPAQTFKGRWSRWIPILATHGTAIPIPTASESASTGDIPHPSWSRGSIQS
ncbi:MAG: hypothetical protein ACLRSD_10710 [Oscillibacter sp.]